MSKRVTAVPLAALLLLSACTGTAGTEAPASTPVSAPATASAAPTQTEAGPTAGPTAGQGDPGDGDMLAGKGDRADWAALVEPCPNDGQEVIVQKVVTADVTGDGVADALVARSCEASTSYWPSTVDVLDGASPAAKPRRVGTLLDEAGATDQPWLTKLRVTDGTVVIEANGVGKGSDNACPRMRFTYRYRLDGNSFERTAREAKDAGTCLPVG